MHERVKSLLWWEIANLSGMQQEVLWLAWEIRWPRQKIAKHLRISPDTDVYAMFVAMNERANAQRVCARRRTTGDPAEAGDSLRTADAAS